MRHTFGELKGKQMMQRLSTLARTLKYWTVIEQPIEFGVPFWLYEEIAKQKLPPNRATERIAEYRTHTKFDAPISRAVIAEEGEKLKSSHSTRGLVATMEDDKSSNCDNVSPLILKDSKDSSGDIVAESTIAIQSTKEEKTLIPVTETVSDPGLKLRTLTIDLPQWVLEGLDGIARKNKLSVAKMIEKLVKDELDGVAMTALPPTEKKDAPTIRTDN